MGTVRTPRARRNVIGRYLQRQVPSDTQSGHVHDCRLARSDLSGLIAEGVPIGTPFFRKHCLERVCSRALDAVSTIACQSELSLPTRLVLVTKCVLPTVNFQFGVAEVDIACRLAVSFHEELRVRIGQMLGAELSVTQFDQMCLPVRKFGGFGLNSPRDFAVASIIENQLSLANACGIFNPYLPDALLQFNMSVGEENRISVANARSTELLAMMPQKELTARVHGANYARLLRALSNADSLRLQVAGAPGAGLWLQSAFADLLKRGRGTEQVMTDDAFRVHLGMRLVGEGRCMPLEFLDATHASGFVEDTICGNIARSTGRPRTAKLDAACVHSSSCCKVHKYDLHNCTTDSIDFVATLAGLQTTKCNLQVGGDNGVNKRVDLGILNRPALLIDVSMRSPYIRGAAPMERDVANGTVAFNFSFHVKRARRRRQGTSSWRFISDAPSRALLSRRLASLAPRQTRSAR
jgi:hypothetical protein